MGKDLTQQRGAEVGDAARWPRVRLGDVCEEIHERTSSSLVSVDRYITTDNMLKNCAGVSVAEYVPKDVGLVRYAQGDVLLANIRPYLKKLWRATWNGGCSSDVVVFRSRSIELSSEYLFAALSQDRFFDYVMQKPRGTKMPRGDRDWMKGFEFPLPPLSVQHEIVARLERELGAVDKLAKKFDELEAAAEAEFKAELKETFEEIKHRGTEVRRLGDVCEVVSARRVHKSDWQSNGVPFYRAREIVKLSTRGVVDNELFISEKLYEQYKQSSGVPAANDLMVSAVGSVGKVYVVKDGDRFYYKDASVLCFKNKSGQSPKYLKYLIESPDFCKMIHEKSGGATVDTITIERAKEYEVLIPHLPVQREVVARLDAAKAKKEKLVAAARRGRETAALMRKAILKEAFE